MTKVRKKKKRIKNPVAKALSSPVCKPKTEKPKKGRGSFKREKKVSDDV